MKKIALVWLMSSFLLSCQNNHKVSESTQKSVSKNTANLIDSNRQNDGAALLKQYCAACHMLTPDPAKRDKMAAPPFVRVVEHYKARYPSEKQFVAAIVKWVNHPTDDAVQMPGAVRHFGLMPPMPVGDENIKKIATYLYRYDFGNFGGGHRGRMQNMHNRQTGQKAELQKADVIKIKQSIQWLQNTSLASVTDYQNLGKKLFNTAKGILLNPAYKSQDLSQVQQFFHSIEADMHNLMSVKTKKDGEKYRRQLLTKMADYKQFLK